MSETTKQPETVERSGQAPFAGPACSVPTAAELLERAHDMLARAHIMLDGWQQAVDWHHDYERFKAQNAPHELPPAREREPRSGTEGAIGG